MINLFAMKIVNINVERNKHLKTVIPFLQKENPETVCFQEIMEKLVFKIASNLNMHVTFVPFAVLDGWEEGVTGDKWGIAVLTKRQHNVFGIHYYQGTSDIKVFKEEQWTDKSHESISRAVLVVEVHDQDSKIVIGTTHFTYTPNGEPDNWQRESLKKLLEALTPYKNLILCGDFNIPKNTEMYHEMNKYFIDNIPDKYKTSLDPELHRVRGLEYMVDYLWSRGSFKADDVRLRFGVSDHCAIVGDVVGRIDV